MHAGPDFITSAPCLVGTFAQGVGIQAAAINIIPQLFSITPTGDALSLVSMPLRGVRVLVRGARISGHRK